MELDATSRSRRLGQRLNELLLGVPVFVKVMGIALGMAVVLVAGMLWQIHQTWHRLLREDLKKRSQEFVVEVASQCAELARAGRLGEIMTTLQHALSESPDTTYLVLEDEGGAVVAEARRPGSPPEASTLVELEAKLAHRPYRLRAGLSTAGVDREVAWLTGRLAKTTAIIALLGIAAVWGLTRIFARPIEELVSLTRAVKGGDYQGRALVRARDEVGELAAAFNEMTDAIAQKESVRQQLLRQVIRAGEEERKRIARELHDHTGQVLTSQIAALSALESQCRDEPMRQRLADLRELTEQTLAEVHDLSVALRPSVLDDVGLMAALQRHCRLFGQRAGVQVTCADIGLDDRRLPAEVELTLYRLIQEALTNAVRHGRASRIEALVQRTTTGVLAIVQDNGCGFDAREWQKRCLEGNHLGLLGLEERVTLLGGSFCVQSEPGKGTTVHADIPLKETP